MRSHGIGLLVLLVPACGLDRSGQAPDSDHDASVGGATVEASAGAANSGGLNGGSGGITTGGSAGAISAGSGGIPPADASDAEGGSGAIASGGAAGFITALDGQRIELPCGPWTSPACIASQTTKTLSFEGTPGTIYSVKLRLRGVVEQNSYIGGSQSGYFYRSGGPDNAGWNVYSITVSGPSGVYYLNAGSSNILHCFAIDYQETIDIAAGASIVLSGNAMDGQQVINIDDMGSPIVVNGIAPAPDWYDGQFIQIDVVSIQAK